MVGTFQYLTPETRSSLRRNGLVRTRRDQDGSDEAFEGVHFDARTVDVIDARASPPSAGSTLDAHGFELRARPRLALDFKDHEAVVRAYYPDCAALVQQATGATHVVAFDHNVRSAGGKQAAHRLQGGQQVQGPAHLVHGDYTLTSAPERVARLARPPRVNDTLRAALSSGETALDPALAARVAAGDVRFRIVNVWRNIADEPVATHPLALCDGRTVDLADLVVFEIHYADRIGENYFAKFSAEHRWYSYPHMTGDEALLLKQWDSAGPLARSNGAERDRAPEPCTFSFHSAFDDPATPADAPDRWSIEVRTIAIDA